MDRAASRNFKDAERLRIFDRRLGAIYLYGYSVEMTVKAAYFRFHFRSTGANAATQITTSLRAQRANTWQAVGALRKPGPHDIEGWGRLLERSRVHAGQPYSAPFAYEVVARATNIYLHWREFMRYRAVHVRRSEMDSVRKDAAWFRRNSPQL